MELFAIIQSDIQSDIQSELKSDCFLFADDTLLLNEVNNSPEDTRIEMNSDLDLISSWAKKWLVTMNASKPKSMIFSLKKNPL